MSYHAGDTYGAAEGLLVRIEAVFNDGVMFSYPRFPEEPNDFMPWNTWSKLMDHFDSLTRLDRARVNSDSSSTMA